MKYTTATLVVITSMFAFPANAQQQPLDAQCSSAATQATGYLPGTATPTPPPGQRVRGAAAGATIGAIGGDAGKGAAAGVVAGGVAKRHQRREAARDTQSKSAAWQNSYNACLQQKNVPAHN